MASKAKKTAAKKPVKKVVAKKATAKKIVKKAVQAPAKKKVVAKPAKKSVAKPAKKTLAKAAKKTVVKATKKVAAQKPVKTGAKKVVTQKAKTPAVKKLTPVVAKASVKNLDYSKAITPLGDRLVIRVVQGEKMTAGGLIIPDMVSSAIGHLKGEVLAVGQGGKNKKGAVRPLDVKIGDEVLFAEYAGTKIEFNAEELQIVHETDVMGIVQK